MAYTVELAELFDVDVDQLAGMFALIAPHRLDRFQVAQSVQSQPPQDTADGRWRDADLGCDLLACVALPAQRLDFGACGGRGLAWRGKGPGGAITQPLQTFCAEALDPFGDSLRCHVELERGCGLRQTALDHAPHHGLSTFRRQRRILMGVHSVLRGLAKASTTSASSFRTGWTTS